MDLENKNILITGGASGLGHATATYFKKNRCGAHFGGFARDYA